MTNQAARRAVLAQLETQRFAADQASREQPVEQLRRNALERAGELAQQGRLLESRRVLELNFHQA